MKVTTIKVLSRKILIVFLILVIIIALAAVFVSNEIAHQQEGLSRISLNSEHDQVQAQQALLLLHEAEDDFQGALLTSDDAKNKFYKAKFSEAFNLIDILLRENIDTTKLTTSQRAKVRNLYLKKIALSGRLYTLKHNFDSLLTHIFQTGLAMDMGTAPARIRRRVPEVGLKVSTDTLRKVTVVKKKGFFARIKDAISNKNISSAATSVVVINHHLTNNIIDSVDRKIVKQNKNAYNKRLKELQQHNVQVLSVQKQLTVINIRINNELEHVISDIKDINYSLIREFQDMALKSYRETAGLLNKLYLVALSGVLLFAVLLIIFIISLNRMEAFLLRENERSVAIARQKMHLLLHMSHEIRNPLTAIQGFLHIFSQTSLSSRQVDMLGSIRLSSDMLLQTLNDTLDTAKMETTELKINHEPFNPDFTLKEVMESMEFSAAKKELYLDYRFEGASEVLISGDSFRLKQVMVNLLSNAIKYTNKGGIVVKAHLRNINEEHWLHVDVVDTGDGISLEQQAKLFSKYYQTSSAKGQTGTGLGLYICKQLILLQGGQIDVQSTVGTGSTFSFTIPYKKGIITNVEKTFGERLWLLSGMNILAVDDDKLNLIFLKAMTRKWNVNFFQAANGKEALDIITEKSIQIVLTDLQMPDMDGKELVAAIRKLPAPWNQLPVVAVSGDLSSLDTDQLWSGAITKPYTEGQLFEQIALALDL
ncbi:hybrid sensor histidine kinase/response regulator [Mucilaginibacter sp. SP1R1]|uniref:ATP-binding response regulator n=1 Tax=Mucilaginibacter sp. SP1R1 TaxID=2723091 RepID=UPI00160887C2|nr:ATP-binding protein [Mucilaginibacter sp. SP1R1]MBB6148277.1 signal transduction histidine kinase/CheY-like chemotaxis protein [Mucilaginibacter sp. SP1R1]